MCTNCCAEDGYLGPRKTRIDAPGTRGRRCQAGRIPYSRRPITAQATTPRLSVSSISIHGLSAGTSDDGLNGTDEVLELFAAFGSLAGAGLVGPVGELPIVAVFDSVDALEVGGAFITSVIGAPAPTASEGIVQVTVPALLAHVHPVPPALTNTAPAGRVSVTVKFGAEVGPAFDVLIVYVIACVP